MRKFIYIVLCALLFTTGYLSLSLLVQDNNISKLPGSNISITQEVDFSKMNIAKFETSSDYSSQYVDFEPEFNNAINNTASIARTTVTTIDNANSPVTTTSGLLASASSTNSGTEAIENLDVFISRNKNSNAAQRTQSYGFKALSMSADLIYTSTKQAVNSADYHAGDITHPGGAPDGPAIPVGDGLICMLIFAIAYITYIYKRTETAKKRAIQSTTSV